jgi:DNA-binding response OmpR family regulator
MPKAYQNPRVLIVNSGHYLPKEQSQLLAENAFPLNITRPIIVETLDEAIAVLQTEEVDVFLAALTSDKIKQEMAILTKMVASNRGVETLSAHGITLDKTTRMVTHHERIVKLSNMEARLLSIMLARPDTPIATEYFLYSVWNTEDPEDNYLVRSAIKRLRNKIETDPRNPCHIRYTDGCYILTPCEN